MQGTAHLLFVDRDERHTQSLIRQVQQYGYQAKHAQDELGMHEIMAIEKIDLVILDNLLPTQSGLSITYEFRRISKIPIIILSNSNSPYDRIIGLESGADDFIEKPCEPRELIARIRSILRRKAFNSQAADTDEPNNNQGFGWMLEKKTRSLHEPGGKMILLSQTEFDLLATLMHHPGRLLTRDQLLNLIHGRTCTAERNIDLQIYRLRQKLTLCTNHPELIRTVRGKGYILNIPEPPQEKWGSSYL